MNKYTLRYLALGDSYTKGESITHEGSFPVQLQEFLTKKGIPCALPDIIAETGWTTSDLNESIEEKQPASEYDLVTLLIGVNNLYQGLGASEYKMELETLLMKSIRFAGNRKERVFVLSIPDYGYTPFGNADQGRISVLTDQFNALNREASRKAGVHYIYITGISRVDAPSMVAGDGLHPSALQYQKWVELLGKSVVINYK